VPKRPLTVLLDLNVRTSRDMPLHRQLYLGIRGLILDGRLKPGARLPSTRNLANELMVSRTTVLNAFEQLIFEGYLEGRVGSGTKVSACIPGDVRHLTSSTEPARLPKSRRAPKVARRAPLYLFDKTLPATPIRPLRPGLPDIESLPLKLWSQLTAKHWRRAGSEFTQHGDSLGFLPLRQAICEYVSKLRAVRCAPDQILITAGAQQALYLCATALLDVGETIWMEDPGYLRARAAFSSAKLKTVPVPVDAEGLKVSAGIEKQPAPQMIYVTPSFQCPLGLMMSLPRRFELLRTATEKNAWILEDDYFSEYRYGTNPVASLQSLDRNERVIYIGNFSKSIVPFLRIGFLIVPPSIVNVIRMARSSVSRQPPGVDQAALAEFIGEGHLERHIRATLQIYRERHEALVDAIRQYGNRILETSATGIGMYLVAWLPKGVDDGLAARVAFASGVDTVPLSTFSVLRLRRAGLVLGYSGYDAKSIRTATKQLCDALSNVASGPARNRFH
jgi:GntR family transcriptional regulator / MocR family aminotransferase